MALRKFGSLVKFSTKTGLATGTIYLYCEAGLWKGTDATIENYDKLKKDVGVLYNANPDVRKWIEYVTSSASSNVKPYSEAISSFRKEWLNFDVSGLAAPVDGILKPAWNKGVTWTIEAIADSPQTIQTWGNVGWQKLTELTLESKNVTDSPADSKGSATTVRH